MRGRRSTHTDVFRTALVSDGAKRSDPNLVVLRNSDGAHLAGLRMFVSESDMTPFTRGGDVTEAAEYLRYLSPGERLPDYSSLHALRQLIVLVKIVKFDVHLVSEELVRVVDRITPTIFESKHLGQLCKGLGACLPATGQPGFDISGAHATVVLVDEFHPLLLTVPGRTRHMCVKRNCKIDILLRVNAEESRALGVSGSTVPPNNQSMPRSRCGGII
jgi:hypothetical protein